MKVVFAGTPEFAQVALERLLAGDPRTARPVPDLAKLKAAAPLRESPGFMGFG